MKTISLVFVLLLTNILVTAQELSVWELRQKASNAENGVLGVGQVGVDLERAFSLYKKAAEKGDDFSQNKIGTMYKLGQGVSPNLNKAFYWFEKAAKQGYDIAQSNLGSEYKENNDLTKAIYWYKKAANQDLVVAQYNLGTIYKETENYQDAIYWLTKAANNGQDRAQCNLGSIYLFGQGVEANYKLAFGLYKKSATQNNKVGQYYLARCYENEWGCSKDMDRSIFWYKKSAEQGLSHAIKALTRLGY